LGRRDWRGRRAPRGHLFRPRWQRHRTAKFGTNPTGQYTYRGRSAFGDFGAFDDSWFSDSDMGKTFQQFLTGLAQTENRFASILSPEEIARARAAMAGSREYGFGEEHADFGATLSAITRDRMSAMVEAIMPGFGRLIAAADGTAEDFVNLAQAILGLRDAGKSIDQIIAQISGNSVALLTASLDAMNTRVARAKTNLDDAFTANDPTKIYQTEQDLAQAVLERYQSEIQMVRDLQAAIRQLDQEAYQFAVNIAQKINSVGGSRDIAAIAMGRATTLRGGIGSGPLGNQIEDVQNYVGAIDTWYNARRTQIERDMQAQMQAQQAMARAAAAAAQARVQQLQDELALANNFKGVLDRAKQMLEDMKLSTSNPLAATGRIALQSEDLATLRDTYQGSTGYGRVDAANALLDALQRYRELGQDTYQRSSPEWQAMYNEIMRDIGMIQNDAKGPADQAVELQRQILEVQRQAAAYQASAASDAATSSAELDSLNQEALGYYTWAESEGARLYAAQRQQHQEQLDAITGGMEVELFIAQRQAEAVDILKSIEARIAAWLAATGAAVPGTGTTPTPGPGTTPTGNPKIVMQIDSRVLGEVLMPMVDKRVTGPLLLPIKKGLKVT
jgi:predicted  nucleic acid-binding Zn-ribbon protein